jgi:motility quorum-sensing regulator/GCU-specific mRNA interferase toxin
MDIFRKAHYDLDELKTLLQNISARTITALAQKNAFALGYLTDDEIVNRCIQLKKTEIYKTMTTHYDHTLWQDVYKTKDNDKDLYIKLQKNKHNSGVVIQFKAVEE